MSERIPYGGDEFPTELIRALPKVTMVYANVDDDKPVAYISAGGAVEVTERGQRLGFSSHGGLLLGPDGKRDPVWLGSTDWPTRLAAMLDTPAPE
jgi:hypothetical protein